MKKMLTCLLTLALALTCLWAMSLQTNAATVASGTCGDNLTWTLDDAGTLTISGTGYMWDYYDDYMPWYSNQKSIKTVIIQSGVTYIGNFAFEDCSSLTSVTIPDSVTIIGNNAFSSCSNLTGIWVNKNNPAYCSDDQGVLLNKNKTTLFRVPSKLTGSYTIPDGVVSISNSAFEDCSSLTSVAIPETVQSVGYSAFRDCTSLEKVFFGGTLEQWEEIFVDSNNKPLWDAEWFYETLGALLGDLDGVEGISEDDAVYLLQAILMPDLFPL